MGQVSTNGQEAHPMSLADSSLDLVNLLLHGSPLLL